MPTAKILYRYQSQHSSVDHLDRELNTICPTLKKPFLMEVVSYVTAYAEPTETENKLGLKIRNLFKNCNCATAQELELSGNLFVHGT